MLSKMKLNWSVLVVLTLILLNGCIWNDSSDEGTDIEKDLYQGTKGVVLDIVDENIPDELYENEEINYVAKFTNEGPYQVNNAKLLVSVDKGYMHFSNEESVYGEEKFGLEGKTQYNMFDDFEIKELTIYTGDIDPLSEYHDASILTTFCYDYKGIAITDVCIDTDPYDTKATEDICDAGEVISLSKGQGGPVVIDRIETTMLTENDFIRPQFKIHMKNVGQGTVIQVGSVTEVCSSDGLVGGTYNTIKFDNIELSNFKTGDFECFPKGISLRKEEDFVTCTLKSGKIPKSDSSYMSPLKIEISYGYTQSESKEVRILRMR